MAQCQPKYLQLLHLGCWTLCHLWHMLQSMSTSRQAQERIDYRHDVEFYAELDEDLSFMRELEDSAGNIVQVVFSWVYGFPEVVGVIRDDTLCENFSHADATRWCSELKE